jgi:hypothetical protein
MDSSQNGDLRPPSYIFIYIAAKFLHNASHSSIGTLAIDTRNSFISTDGPLVTVLGVEGLAVVATMDAVLVLPLSRTQDVKTIIDKLEA